MTLADIAARAVQFALGVALVALLFGDLLFTPPEPAPLTPPLSPSLQGHCYGHCHQFANVFFDTFNHHG